MVLEAPWKCKATKSLSKLFLCTIFHLMPIRAKKVGENKYLHSIFTGKNGETKFLLSFLSKRKKWLGIGLEFNLIQPHFHHLLILEYWTHA